MISLKKHIESYSQELADATVRAYKASLAAVDRHLSSAVPGVEGDLSGKLERLREQLQDDVAPATVVRVQERVDSELSDWSGRVERHLRSKAAEAREIMLAMAGAAQSLTSRDRRYAGRFREMTTRLEGIADLDDLSEVRRSLMTSAFELNNDIRNMETEGQRTIAGLEVKLQDYRKQLAEAERRECADRLTGLVNRRGIELEIERRRDEHRPFCVVLLDLDCFKPVNDTHGHAAGDDLLRQFAGELRPHFRSSDLIGRWGGDEFIAVLPGDLENARVCVDRVRKWAFGTYKITTPKGICAVPLTASVGIALWDMEEDLQQLLGRADESMYVEKRAATAGART